MPTRRQPTPYIVAEHFTPRFFGRGRDPRYNERRFDPHAGAASFPTLDGRRAVMFFGERAYERDYLRTKAEKSGHLL